MNTPHCEKTSSKTLYKTKNLRNIKHREEQVEIITGGLSNLLTRASTGKNSSNTSFSSEKIDTEKKSIEEMSLKEKAKNFLECYDDLVLLITQKNLR